MFTEFYKNYKNDLIQSYNQIKPNDIEKICEKILTTYSKNKKIIIFGNGGSAATASHFVCDLAKGASILNKKKFKVISLNDNIPLITATGNDISYKEIFKEQLENIIESEDLVIGISASGNSENVIRAINLAKSKKAYTIGLLGFTGGKLKELCDFNITINNHNYGQVEDIHLSLLHIIPNYLKTKLNKQNKAIFLDRDGVICYNKENYIRNTKDFTFLPGAIKALKIIQDLNYKIFTISNQAGIGKGLISKIDHQNINNKMLKTLNNEGINIDEISYCPHTQEENCNCRKPKIGQITKYIQKYNINTNKSFFIGDAPSDIQAGQNAQLTTVFVESGKYSKIDIHNHNPDLISKDLYTFSKILKKIHHDYK